jgi:hypothetical protein
MRLQKLSDFQKFKLILAILLNLVFFYEMWISEGEVSLYERVIFQAQFIVVGIAFIFYKPKWWEKTTFTKDNVKNWFKNFLILYTGSYFLTLAFILLVGVWEFSLNTILYSLLWALIVSIILSPILLFVFFIYQFLLELLDFFK